MKKVLSGEELHKGVRSSWKLFPFYDYLWNKFIITALQCNYFLLTHRQWNMATGIEIFSRGNHVSTVHGLSLTNNHGLHIVSGSRDRSLR